VRHARFDVASLSLEAIDVVLKAAYLLVAESDHGAHLQWECVAYALDPAPLAPAEYRVAITTLDGRLLTGDAVLVRSVDGAHVLRGTGPLAGVSAADLR